jgi:hypothetical protein
MKRRLQLLAVCVAALLAVRLMAQDNGAGAGGDASGGADTNGAASPDTSGASDNSGSLEGNTNGAGGNTNGGGTGNTGGGTNQNGNGNTNGNSNEGLPLPGGGSGTQNGNGLPGTGDLFGPVPGAGSNSLFGPVTTPEGTGLGNSILPEPAPSAAPGELIPAATPSPTPFSPFNPASGNTAAPVQAPVTFTLPGGYGGGPATTFTLGQGVLARPPITASLSVSQGYDDNIYSAPSHFSPTPTPTPGPTPPLEARLITFRISPPLPPRPVYEYFRPKVPTPTPAPTPLGIVGSPVSSISLGVNIQKGTPRTVFVMGMSLGLSNDWNENGGAFDFTGSLNLQLVHRITERATLSISMNAVYQKTPNFALINAPTTNGNNSGNYLNGNASVDFTYDWTSRISTVTTYNANFELLQTDASQNLIENSYGTQFRYTVSPRTTVTAELRQSLGQYANANADLTDTFYLLGMDTIFTDRLRNTFGAGIETQKFASSGATESEPYFESNTSLVLPRGASLDWSNRYGYQESGGINQTITSYRTTLSYGQPLSTKLNGSISIAYNNFKLTDTQTPANDYTQNQFQFSASLGYSISPRLSLSLSYTYLYFLSTVPNSDYVRNQIYLGGSYTFQ